MYGDSRLKDVDDVCIGGCVAKLVCTESEQLKFFNTVSLADRDLKIAEVCFNKLPLNLALPDPREMEIRLQWMQRGGNLSHFSGSKKMSPHFYSHFSGS